MDSEVTTRIFDLSVLISECCPAECQVHLLQQCCCSIHGLIQIHCFASFLVLHSVCLLAFSIAVYMYFAPVTSHDGRCTTERAVLVWRIYRT
jgi:hypothetical protein